MEGGQERRVLGCGRVKVRDMLRISNSVLDSDFIPTNNQDPLSSSLHFPPLTLPLSPRPYGKWVVFCFDVILVSFLIILFGNEG